MNRQPLILAVDDHESMRGLFEACLKASGYRVVTATDGLSALAQFRTHQPDLVILDMIMPGVGGLDVLREIRSQSNVPVIMVTALSDRECMVNALRSGADDFVTKPFSSNVLAARVGAKLRRAEAGFGWTTNGAPVSIE